MSDTKPNVVFMFSDQHRASALGCSGNDDVQTPNIDELAAEGERFTNACANYPVCGPSRASLISGQYPASAGVIKNDMALGTDVPSVGEAFQEAGYRTGYIGKWHLDGVPRDKPTPPGPRRQGFDDFWAVYNCAHDYYNAQYYDDEGQLHEIDSYEPIGQANLALQAIEEFAEADEPFCLFVSWGPPHDPYRLVPEKYREQYRPDSLSMRPNAEPLLPRGENNPASPALGGPPVQEWGPTTCSEYETGWRYEYNDPRDILADYYAAVSALDEQVGRISESLADHGITDSTILAYSSDHGDMMFSQGLNQKGFPFIESINVPFVVRWPEDIPAGSTNDAPIGITDFAPTLLELADIQPPEAMEGRSYAETIRDPSVAGSDSVFLQGSHWRGVKTRDYTYARVNPDWSEYQHVPGGHWLLFDDKSDPYQLHNLVYDSETLEQGVRSRLSRLLDDWLQELGDPFDRTREAVKRLGLAEEYNDVQRYHRSRKTGDVSDRYPLIDSDN